MTGVLSRRNARLAPAHFSCPRRNFEWSHIQKRGDGIEVEPGSESATGSGQNHHPHIGIPFEIVAQCGDLIEHRERKRVELVRPVKGHQQHSLARVHQAGCSRSLA
jgi:hypothetical protein